MSRSEKHTPIIKVARGSTKISKRLAAKAARHCNLPDGGQYRKCFMACDIFDQVYNLYQDYDSQCHPRRKGGQPMTPKVLRDYWNK